MQLGVFPKLAKKVEDSGRLSGASRSHHHAMVRKSHSLLRDAVSRPQSTCSVEHRPLLNGPATPAFATHPNVMLVWRYRDMPWWSRFLF